MAQPVAPSMYVPRVLWGALLASQGIYVALLTIPGLIEHPTAPTDPAMLPALAGTAIAVAIASFLVPRAIRRNALARADVEVIELPDASAITGFRSTAPTVRVFASSENARRTAYQLALTPLILSLALSEAISLFGFVLGFLGHPPLAWAPFFVVGASLTALRFPTENGFVEPLAVAKQARFDASR